MKHLTTPSRRVYRRAKQAIGAALTAVVITVLTASYALAAAPAPEPKPTLNYDSDEAPPVLINLLNGLFGTVSIIGITLGTIGMIIGAKAWSKGKEKGMESTIGSVIVLVLSSQLGRAVGLFSDLGGWITELAG